MYFLLQSAFPAARAIWQQEQSSVHYVISGELLFVVNTWRTFIKRATWQVQLLRSFVHLLCKTLVLWLYTSTIIANVIRSDEDKSFHLYNNALVSVSVCSALFEISAISPCLQLKSAVRADFTIEEKVPKTAFSRVIYNLLPLRVFPLSE